MELKFNIVEGGETEIVVVPTGDQVLLVDDANSGEVEVTEIKLDGISSLERGIFESSNIDEIKNRFLRPSHPHRGWMIIIHCVGVGVAKVNDDYLEVVGFKETLPSRVAT